MRILIAGADPRMRSALGLLMQRRLQADELQEAGDIDELCCQAQACPPALLLLDWKLPGLQAEQGLAAIHETFPKTRIVVLSIKNEDRAAAMDAGAAGFVYKGLAPDEVIGIIGELAQGLPGGTSNGSAR